MEGTAIGTQDVDKPEGAAAFDGERTPDAPVSAKPAYRIMLLCSPLALILLLGLALRLYHINYPPVDFLSWRDTQTLMVARNFYREGMNLFLPSVDWRTVREVTPRGTVGGAELQIVPYLTAALYFVFGMHVWVGRVVPIFFALAGAAYFYLLVRRFYGQTCAVLSALLLTVSPYFLYCGRVQMPESFVFAMSFAALYYYDKWLSSVRNESYWPAVLFSALTLLGKPQLGIIIFPMAFLTFHYLGLRALLRPRLYLFVVLAGASAIAFMWWSFEILRFRTGLSFAHAGLLGYRRFLTDPHYYFKIGQAVWLWAVTPPVCLLALLGLLTPKYRGRGYFVHAWTFGAIAFFFLIPGGNNDNGYYHLILAPPATILAARALEAALLHRGLRFVAPAILAGAMGYSLYVTSQLYIPRYTSAYDCGAWIRDNTAPDTLVITATGSPATLYFADRVGWTTWGDWFGTDANKTDEFINTLIGLGAKVLAARGKTPISDKSISLVKPAGRRYVLVASS